MIVVPYLSDGGAERVASLWANFLSKNYQVLLLTYYTVNNEYSVDKNVERKTLVTTKNEYDKISFMKKIKIIRNYIDSFGPDVIIPFLSHTNIAVSLANKRKKTVVFQTIRNNPWLNPGSKFFRFLRNHFIKKEKKLIIQNNEQGEYFKKYNFKKYVVCNPVNPATMEINSIKISYDKIKKIIAVGRLHEQKNYKMMIDSIYDLVFIYKMNVILDIYGDGPQKKELIDYINMRNMTNYVFLKGRCDDIISIEKDYDLFLMTSNYEGFPNALLEAMAVGLPVISTDCKTGPKDLINNGVNGFLVKTNDSKELSKKISEVNDELLLKKIGTLAREDVLEKYNMQESMRQLTYAIEDVSK